MNQQTPSRERNRAYQDERVDGYLTSLRDRFDEGRIWREANEPVNGRNERLLNAYNATVDLMVRHHIPLRLLWQESGIFDRVVDDTSPRLSGTISFYMHNSVQQMVSLMQREEGRDPTVAWIWPPDTTIYSDERPFVGSPNEAHALGVDEAPLMTTRSHTVRWGQFGLDHDEDGSNIRIDGRSQGNNRRPHRTPQQLRTPERRPVRPFPGAPRRNRQARRPAPFIRQASPLLLQARPPARRNTFGDDHDQEPPAQRRRFRIPSPLSPPQPPTQPPEINLVEEEEEIIDLVEEEGVAVGEADEMVDRVLQAGPSQPPVETRDSLVRRLEELQARSRSLVVELVSNSRDTSDVRERLEELED